MPIINNIEYLTLPQQVEKNKTDIAKNTYDITELYSTVFPEDPASLFQPKFKIVYDRAVTGTPFIVSSSTTPVAVTLNTTANYTQKTLAFDIGFGMSSETYTTLTTFYAKLGSETTTTPSSTIPRNIFTYTFWDGLNRHTLSFKASANNTDDNKIYIYNLKQMRETYTLTSGVYTLASITEILSNLIYIQRIYIIN